MKPTIGVDQLGRAEAQAKLIQAIEDIFQEWGHTDTDVPFPLEERIRAVLAAHDVPSEPHGAPRPDLGRRDERDAASPQATPAPTAAIAGDRLDMSLDEFVRRCEVHVGELQESAAPDNALIATLCDGARLAREYAASRSPAPTASAAPTDDELLRTLRAALVRSGWTPPSAGSSWSSAAAALRTEADRLRAAPGKQTPASMLEYAALFLETSEMERPGGASAGAVR